MKHLWALMKGASIALAIFAALILWGRSLRSEEIRPTRSSETTQALRAHALSQQPPHTAPV